MGLNAHELTAAKPNLSIAHATEKTADGKEKIDFQGTLSLTSGTMKASVNRNMVRLAFTQNIGLVNVSLYDDNGNLVYSCSVDTAVQKMAMLPTAGGHEGTYTIVVENTSDTAVGQFEHR